MQVRGRRKERTVDSNDRAIVVEALGTDMAHRVSDAQRARQVTRIQRRRGEAR